MLPSPLRGRSAVHTAQLAKGGGLARAVTEMGAHRAQLGAVCLAVAVMVTLPPLRQPAYLDPRSICKMSILFV